MANYNVDIQVALGGLEKIKRFEQSIEKLNQELDALNAKQKQISQGNPYNAAGIRKYGTAAEDAARSMQTLVNRNKDAVKSTNDLIRASEEAVRKKEVFRQLFRDAGAVRGTIRESNQADIAAQIKDRKQGMRKRAGAAISAGAFPLLFGGGPGMAIGGAVGGAAAGATFGPAAIALQVLGGAVDQFVAQTASLGQALNELTFDFDAVIAGSGFTGTELERFVKQIEKFGDATEAQELATKLLAIRIGTEGVDALKRFGSSTSELNREFSVSMSALGAAVANASIPITEFITNLIKRSNQLRAGRENATNDAELKALGAREKELLAPPSEFIETRGFELEKAVELEQVLQKIRDRQAEIEFMARETARIRAEDLQRLDNELSTQTDNLNVLALRRELLQNGKTLSAEELAIAKENIAKGRIQVKRERLLVEQAQLVERAKGGELSFRKVALIIAGKQLEIDEALQKLETKGKKDREGPRSRALQLQAALLREKLKQFDIEMDVQSLNETRIKSLQRQNQGIEERRDKEVQILELQRQQEIANNKVPGDVAHINGLYDARKKTIKDTLELQINQNNARIQAIQLQQSLAGIKGTQKTESIGLGLDRQIKDAQNRLASPFGTDDNEMLKLRIEQTRRLDDARKSLTDQIDIQNKIVEKGDASQRKAALAEIKHLEERIHLYEKLLPQLDAVEQAELRQQQILEKVQPVADAVAAGLVNVFRSIADGSMSAKEAFANMLMAVADALAQQATKMIATYIAIGIARLFAGIGSAGAAPTGAAAAPASKAGTLTTGPLPNLGSGPSFGSVSDFAPATILPAARFAQGGFVSSPTSALIGEGGESEYVVPASKMNEAMGRYARGARGGAVIPDGSGGDAGGEMGGGGGSIDVSYSVERINNVNYVTAAEFEKGMAQAAKRGAELGKRGVYSDLINKRSVRSRVSV